MLNLDYVQRDVLKHALECLLEDCREVKSLRDQAQYVVNNNPPRKKKGENSHQSVEVVIAEILNMLN